MCHDGADAEDALLQPCACRGSQAMVHKSCLQLWQRSVQLSTVTNRPQDVVREERHLVCNVCKARFDLAPPSRADLVADLAGCTIEIVTPGLLLVSTRREASGPAADQLPLVLQVLREIKHMHFNSAVYVLTEAMEQHSGRGNEVSDAILGVNLVRAMGDEGEQSRSIQNLLSLDPSDQARLRESGVHLQMFNGGPVGPKVVTAIALVTETHSRRRPHAQVRILLEAVCGDGEKMTLLIGPAAAVLEVAQAEAALRCGTVPVACYAGYAVWSRTQLLGEMARGSWLWRDGVPADVLPVVGGPNQWQPRLALYEACRAEGAQLPLRRAAPNEMSRDFEARLGAPLDEAPLLQQAQPNAPAQHRRTLEALVREFERRA